MISVEITYSQGHFSTLLIQGHGTMEKGTDLACAGASLSFIGAMNALEDKKGFCIKTDSGDSACVAKKEPSLHDETVLETLVVQLTTLAHFYPSECRVRVTKEE